MKTAFDDVSRCRSGHGAIEATAQQPSQEHPAPIRGSSVVSCVTSINRIELNAARGSRPVFRLAERQAMGAPSQLETHQRPFPLAAPNLRETSPRPS
jgi:hypothetical protein